MVDLFDYCVIEREKRWIEMCVVFKRCFIRGDIDSKFGEIELFWICSFNDFYFV